ncbi:MAG: EAL domain-containing protein [Actinomycetes bacterium]
MYVGWVAVSGVALLVLTWWLAPPWEMSTGDAWTNSTPAIIVISLLCAALVLGELRPIPISRGGDLTDWISISTTFAVALIVLGPVSIAVGAQVVAVLVDDLRMRRSPSKVLFNAGQYVMTIVAARAVYAAVSGTPFAAPTSTFDPTPLAFTGAILAGATFLVVNHGLVSIVVAMQTQQSILVIMSGDIRFQVMTNGVLAALGPVAAVALEQQPFMLPLLVAPVVAVYRSADLAIQKERQAYHDTLTELPNRELFRDRAVHALEDSQRTGVPLAVMMIDLDHFKEINDTLGHHIGDELIREVARRLDDSRPVGSTVARLGGDEFAVLLPDVPDISVAEEVATYLLSVLGKSFSAGGVRLVVQASIGISLAPDHGADVHTLMKNADIALYEAKRERARFSAYQPDSDVHTPQRLAILADLRAAVDEGQLFLEFQPKIDLATDTVMGAEALVRWNHPTRGIIRPDDFIPLAENTGLIAPITWFVIERSLQQCRYWRDQGLDIGVAVNLSVRHLSDMSLPDRVGVALERWGVPASQLTVEVTESSIMTDPQRAVGVIRHLRQVGIGVAIDDYGTGHASLTYLKRLEIDELKIDKSFIMHMTAEGNDAIIVRSTIELGHNLGLRIVAEGVEDAATLEWLRNVDCDVAQGYHLARPMAPEAVEELAWRRLGQQPQQKPASGGGRLRLVGLA